RSVVHDPAALETPRSDGEIRPEARAAASAPAGHRLAAEIRHERADHRVGPRPARPHARRATRAARARGARILQTRIRGPAAARPERTARNASSADRRAPLDARDARSVAARLRRRSGTATRSARVICIECDLDSKYKDRKAANGTCPKCGNRFAFEPRDD